MPGSRCGPCGRRRTPPRLPRATGQRQISRRDLKTWGSVPRYSVVRPRARNRKLPPFCQLMVSGAPCKKVFPYLSVGQEVASGLGAKLSALRRARLRPRATLTVYNRCEDDPVRRRCFSVCDRVVCGRVAEFFKAAVLKTVSSNAFQGFDPFLRSLSQPSLHVPLVSLRLASPVANARSSARQAASPSACEGCPPTAYREADPIRPCPPCELHRESYPPPSVDWIPRACTALRPVLSTLLAYGSSVATSLMPGLPRSLRLITPATGRTACRGSGRSCPRESGC